ncbi:hypothetical protein HKX48_003673 [Thoreauomyces humboldtii]|nr:hypothetical protein HKX48_003673 [Thoreauomyces humboldtii]
MAQTMVAEAVTPEFVNQLAAVLAQLVSTDNSVRTASEEALNAQLSSQCELLLAALAHVVRTYPDEHLRSFAAILLRRLALKPKQQPSAPNAEEVSYYVWIGESPRKYIESELLQALHGEQVSAVRHKVADTIAELGKHMLLKGYTWNELAHAIFECARSPAAEHRTSGFQIIAQVPSLVSDTDAQAMKRFFGQGLQDANVDVRLEALHASAAYMNDLEAQMIEPFLDFVLPTIGKEDETQLDSALGYLIELAEFHPRALRSCIPQLIQYTSQLMKDEDLEMTTRQTALEVLLTLAEGAPGMMRKHASFCQSVIPVLLQWMSNLEENEAWFNSDDTEEEDVESDDIVGGEAFDRIARALGGKSVLPITFSLIPSMLASEDWRKRHGALMTISAIGEGCAKIMEAELLNVLTLILPHLRDPHPRVQWATCNALGQMCTDFAPTVQNKYAEMLLTSLVPVLDYSDYPRVQTHAAAALVNFCQEVEKDAIATFLPSIFQKLVVLLNTGKTYVQEQAITTIATVADCAGENFATYYASIMPFLLNILKQAHNKEFRLLRGKTMECASLIALAVGKEVFAPDAAEMIELLRLTQASITDDDDPQSSYLLAAWARLCKVLAEDFVPYLPFVLPPLMRSAQLKPDFALIDTEESEASIREQYDEDWEMLEIDGKRIGIKTTILEEKCTAVEMLICYARELGAGFAPYAKEVMDTVLPLLRFFFHEGVRHAAAGVIPYLFISVLKAQQPPFNVQAAWHEVLKKIVETISDETDIAFLGQLYSTTQECLEVLGPNSTDETLRLAFVKESAGQLEAYFKRAVVREESRRDQDYDAEDEDAIGEEETMDDAYLQDFSTALHQFFRNHGEAYLPQFDILAPYVQRFLNSGQTPARQWAICVFDDVIEFAGPASARYQQQFWDLMAQAIVDPAAEIRQAAAYGVGVAAQFGGPAYTQAVAGALPNLFAAINMQGARLDDNVLATENAVAAVAKICKFAGHAGVFDLDQVLRAWVAAMPIVEDQDEAPLAYTYLLDLIQQNNQAVLGSSNANVPSIALILAEALASSDLFPLAAPDVGAHDVVLPPTPQDLAKRAEASSLVTRIATTLRQMMAACDEATRGRVWNSVDVRKRKVLMDKGYLS